MSHQIYMSVSYVTTAIGVGFPGKTTDDILHAVLVKWFPGLDMYGKGPARIIIPDHPIQTIAQRMLDHPEEEAKNEMDTEECVRSIISQKNSTRFRCMGKTLAGRRCQKRCVTEYCSQHMYQHSNILRPLVTAKVNMTMGIIREPIIINNYMNRTGYDVNMHQRLEFIDFTISSQYCVRIAGRLDGVREEDGVIIEAKSPKYLSRDVYPGKIAQLQMYMHMRGATKGIIIESASSQNRTRETTVWPGWELIRAHLMPFIHRVIELVENPEKRSYWVRHAEFTSIVY